LKLSLKLKGCYPTGQPETAWKVDIEEWSQGKDFTPGDPSTGEIIWNIYLILQPLQTRPAYVLFDKNGDITGQLEGPGAFGVVVNLSPIRSMTSRKLLNCNSKSTNRRRGSF
jgi:hypothetical protein